MERHPAPARRAPRWARVPLVIGIVARFFQKFSKDSTPPNNVVKIVESASKMSPARAPLAGIQMNVLNSLFPASLKGCGLDIAIRWLGRTSTHRVVSLLLAHVRK